MPKRKRGQSKTKEVNESELNDDASGSVHVGTKDENHVNGNEEQLAPEHAVQSFEVPSDKKAIICERHGSGSGKPSLIFTHGAGGGIATAATAEFAEGFAELGPVVLFQGTMNLKSRTRAFHAVIEHEQTKNSTALGGRSMGARAAVITAQEHESDIETLILVSYPMVGGKKGETREQILLDLTSSTNVLFISGSNDSMCDMAHLHRVIGKMSAPSWVVEVQGADHGMSLKAKSKAGIKTMRLKTGAVAAEWLMERDDEKQYCSLGWSEDDEKVVSSGWQSDPVGSEEDDETTRDADEDTRPVKKGKKKK